MDIFTEIEDYVAELFVKDTTEKLFFHKIKHTIEVVEASKLIGEKSGFSEDEMEILLISAWFHDVGYLTKYSGHEEVSVKIAKEFLTSKNYDSENIEKVLNCISATEVPQKPEINIQTQKSATIPSSSGSSASSSSASSSSASSSSPSSSSASESPDTDKKIITRTTLKPTIGDNLKILSTIEPEATTDDNNNDDSSKKKLITTN